MISEHRIKKWMGYLLLTGIYTAILFVACGGIMFLITHPGVSLQQILDATTNYSLDIWSIWTLSHLLTSTGIIEVGMIILIGIQVARVIMLLIYYSVKRDYWFMLFSSFILTVILFSLIRQS